VVPPVAPPTEVPVLSGGKGLPTQPRWKVKQSEEEEAIMAAISAFLMVEE
jgi:hypothetical protein